jgi:heat shock protein HtpX
VLTRRLQASRERDGPILYDDAPDECQAERRVTDLAVGASTTSSRRTSAVLALVAVAPAVVGFVVGWFVGHLVGGVIGLVVLGVAAAALVWIRAGSLTLRSPDTRPADPEGEARLYNLADGLCVTAGVKMPSLGVVDADGLNLAIIGRDAGHATILVTSGLLRSLSRIELEGVLAVGVAGLRQGDAGPATVAAAAFGLGLRFAVDEGRDRRLDETGMALTRYPPGLVSAYEKVKTVGTSVPGVPRHQAHVWLVDPAPTGGPLAPYRTPISQRIDALNEL